jgi:hypothetical protein
VTAAHDYEDMHHLVDRLPPTGVRRLRVLAESDPELAQYLTAGDTTQTAPAAEQDGAQGPRRRRLSFAGIIEGGPPDLAENAEDYLHQRFNHSA